MTLRAGDKAVAGHVPEERTEQLRELWGHRVSVSGILKRNASGQVIHVDVDRLELMPEGNAGRPSTDELLGAAKGWMTDKQLDQFLQRMRRRRG